MMRANTEINAKNNILIVARKLFYEKGYKNTFMDEIAELCGITKPLITYHFSSKAELALAVERSFATENKNKISYKLLKNYYDMNIQDYNLQISTAIEIRMLHTLYLHDDMVSRFTDERADDKYDSFLPGDANKYAMHQKRYHLNISSEKDEISMITKAATAAGYAVLRAYKKGEIQCTEEEVLDYVVSLTFRLMNLSTERVREIVQDSKKIIKQVGFNTKPYFRIE